MAYQYVHGAETEIAKLFAFPAKVEANVIRGAVRAAAAVEVAVARPMVPLGPGRSGTHLAQTLRISTSIRKGTARATVKVGNLKKGVFYAGMVMGGTKPHLIKGKAHNSLSFGGIVRQVVQHPGARAQPFLAEADQVAREAALKAAFDYADARTKKLIREQGN